MRKNVSLLSVLMLFCALAFSQTRTVTGQVKDEKGDPVPFATVTETGTNNATSADANGNFKITVRPEGRLTISASGFQSRTMSSISNGAQNIILNRNEQLSEVVVTGVAQATSKRKLSFALTSVKGSDINIVPQLDASQSLRGRVAGIQINQSQGNAGATVFLRGAKSVFGNINPLIVVDGFQTNLSLSDLNPEDIESIEVVKGGAGAALYGTRAEGGVIQVITKKGKDSRGRPNVRFDAEYGINNIQKTVDLANSHIYKTNPDGSFVLNGTQRTVNYAPNGFSLILTPYQVRYDNTKALLDNRPFQNYTASVSNATGPFNFYLSYQNQQRGGVVKPVPSDVRNTFKINVGYKPWEKVETNVTVQYINFNRPSDFTTANYQGTLFASTLQFEPFINLLEKDAEGNYAAKPTGFSIQNANLYNPLYEWSQRQVRSIANNILLGGDMRWRFAKGFDIFVSGSINREDGRSQDYYPIGYKTVTPSASLNNGNYTEASYLSQFKNFNAQLSYNGSSTNWEYGASLKAIFEDNSYESTNASGYNLSAPVKDLGATDPTTRSISSNWLKVLNNGYFANLRGGWKNKIFIDVLGRIDQSSNYGASVQSAFFPRASIAYRLTQDFKLGAINELKLRAAWGRAGSLPPFGAKSSQAQISSTGISITQLANTALNRSYTDELEVGVDGQLLNRINFSLTYADAISKNDFIQPPSFTPFFGSSSIYRNLGAVKSNSWEAEINGDIIQSKNFTWNQGFTFTRVRSKITDLGNIPDFTSPVTGNGISNVNTTSIAGSSSDPLFRKAVGYSAYSFWGQKVLRSLDELQIDKNGKVLNAGGGSLTPADFVVNSLGFVVEKSKLGTANERPVFYVNPATGNNTFLARGEPDFQIGLPTNLTFFKKINFFFLLDWKQGGYKYNQTLQYLTFDNRTKVFEKFAASGLPIQFVQALYNGNVFTDYWLEKSSFVALRELSLSYIFDGSKLGKLGRVVKSLRVAAIGRNMFYLTKYKGVNPEGYWEYYPYPVYRTISGKLTFTLF